MALSESSVLKAWRILNEINPAANNSFISHYDEDEPLRLDAIIGYDRKSDGGWENVFINVRNISQEQLETFKSRAREIPNSFFIDDKGNGITRIGWF